MDTDQLRKWLGLPPGEWPPPPHVLLGMNADVTDANAVQDRALAQMEKLRPYQLMSPELVTEGMNRLAQALISMEEAKPVSPSKSFAEHALPPLSVPAIFEAKVAEKPLLSEFTTAKPTELVRRTKRKRERPQLPPAVSATEHLIAEPLPLDRRKAYRQIVRLREELRSWERLGPFFGVPSRLPTLSGEVFQLLEALNDARKTLADPPVHGTLVRSVVQQGVAITVFRDLQLSQRETLATEWALGIAELKGHQAAYRLALRSSKPKPSPQRRLRRAGDWFRRHPEWKLAAPLMLALIIAGIRLAKRV
ncbi:hypothetical protein BH11PLA2_BH11PLA2_19190 [soil metagenome]